MLTKAEIIVKGDVQHAGYRGEVLKIAQGFPIKGFVENLKGGSVKIICECEKEVINDFLRAIDIKNEFIDVKEIEKEFLPPRNEFESFEIKFSDMVFELFQGFGTAGKFLKVSIAETRKVGEKVDRLTDITIDFKNQTGTNFQDLDGKYHKISENIEEINKNTAKMTEYIGLLIKDYIDSKKEE